MLKRFFLAFGFFGAFWLSGCAHSYYFRPEIEGENATYGRRGVIYTIPSSDPIVKMKLTSGGLTRAPQGLSIAKGTSVFKIRLALIRLPQASSRVSQYLIPSEQKLILPETNPISPVTLLDKKVDRMVLSPAQTKQGIDLFFAIPKGVRLSRFQSFIFQWIMHTSDKDVESRLVRFDRFDSKNQTDEDESFDEFSGFGAMPGFTPGADGGLDDGGYF